MRGFVLKPEQASENSQVFVFLQRNNELWGSTEGELELRKERVVGSEEWKSIWTIAKWTVKEQTIGYASSNEEDDVDPPTGSWFLTENNIEYDGTYLETSSDLLSKEYLEQEQLRDWDSLINQVVGLLQPSTEGRITGRVVIDVGCGISKRLLSRGASTVIGIDRDPNMVVVSKILCASVYDSPKGETKFYVSDVTHPPSSLLMKLDRNNGIADIVWSSFVIAYLPNPISFIQEWSKILKPDGLLCLIEIDGLFGIHNPLDVEMKTIASSLDKALEPHYFAHYGSRLSTFCAAAGLEVIYNEQFVDTELAFTGKVNTSRVLEGWRSRLSRPGISAKLAKCTNNTS
jgi:SAM-dependent methyltransferase